MSYKSVFLIVIFSIACLLMGYFIGHYVGYGKGAAGTGKPGIFFEKKDSENSFEAGWNAAKQKLEEDPLFQNKPINSLSGKVTEISGQTLKLQAEVKVRNPLSEAPPSIRTINISSNTKITKRIQKSPDEYAQEREEYMEQRQEEIENRKNGEPFEIMTPPERYNEEEAVLEDIKTDSSIQITVNEQDITYLEEITPDVITILSNETL